MVKCTTHTEVQRRDVVYLAPRLAKTLVDEKGVCVLTGYSHIRLCDTVDCSPPGSSVHRILQARTLEWVALPPPGRLPRRDGPVSPPLASSSPLVPSGRQKCFSVQQSNSVSFYYLFFSYFPSSCLGIIINT